MRPRVKLYKTVSKWGYTSEPYMKSINIYQYKPMSLITYSLFCTNPSLFSWFSGSSSLPKSSSPAFFTLIRPGLGVGVTITACITVTRAFRQNIQRYRAMLYTGLNRVFTTATVTVTNTPCTHVQCV